MTTPEATEPADDPLLQPPRSPPTGAGRSGGTIWSDAARSLAFRRPRWAWAITPARLAALVVLELALFILLERLYIPGPALFMWHALQSGWLTVATGAWLCWMLARRATPGQPQGSQLFGLMVGQALLWGLLLGAVFVPGVRLGGWQIDRLDARVQWLLWVVPVAWIAAAQITVLARSGLATPRHRAVAIVVLLAGLGFNQWLRPAQHWYADPTDRSDADHDRFRLTPELIERQMAVLPERLRALAPSRPGVTDLYVLTFAPYAEEDVFQRESDMVAAVMGQRFDATARTVQLVNHRNTHAQWPWATAANLERTIRRAAELMDRDEDVLFLHLTSHGARSGSLSASFFPMEIDPVTPQQLKRWLDESGVRWRVISVSACYAGSWIAPLQDGGTLVLTAADAEHTSLGCGRGSELTYFGRAMYDEQMRQGQPFEAAHRRAHELITQREREANKSDGHSNPQLWMGAGIREVLGRLEAGKAASRPAN